MGQFTYQRYRQIADERFAVLLIRFVSALTGTWKGSADELHEALSVYANNFTDFIPTSSALTKAIFNAEPAISAHGWRIGQGRTNKGRWVEFRRGR